MDISFRVLAHCGMIVGEMGAIITVEGDEKEGPGGVFFFKVYESQRFSLLFVYYRAHHCYFEKARRQCLTRASIEF